jgi:hypothetical protein
VTACIEVDVFSSALVSFFCIVDGCLVQINVLLTSFCILLKLTKLFCVTVGLFEQ